MDAAKTDISSSTILSISRGLSISLYIVQHKKPVLTTIWKPKEVAIHVPARCGRVCVCFPFKLVCVLLAHFN